MCKRSRGLAKKCRIANLSSLTLIRLIPSTMNPTELKQCYTPAYQLTLFQLLLLNYQLTSIQWLWRSLLDTIWWIQTMLFNLGHKYWQHTFTKFATNFLVLGKESIDYFKWFSAHWTKSKLILIKSSSFACYSI